MYHASQADGIADILASDALRIAAAKRTEACYEIRGF